MRTRYRAAWSTNRVNAGIPHNPTPPPAIAGQGYQVVFFDNFNTLDSSVWGPQPQHRLTIPPGAFSVADSILTVRADQSLARPYEEFTSLGPYSATVPHYPNARTWQEGYFEIRARCTDDPWTKLALWFFSVDTPNYFGGVRPCTNLNAEWDMVENGIRSGFELGAFASKNHVSPIHRNTNAICATPDTSHQYAKDGVNLCDWHVWAGKWTATSVSTYLDDVLQGTQAVFDSTAQPLYMIISAAPLPFTPLGPMPPVPAFIETQVDWVRVWQKL